MSALEPKPQPPHPEATRERALEGLFLESPVPMLLVEVRSRRITRANLALGELLGYPPETLAGRPLRDLDSAGQDDVSEHLLLALTCGDRNPRRRTWHTASGEALKVDVQATRLDGDRGTALVLYVRAAQPQPGVARGEDRAQATTARKKEAVDQLAASIAREFGTILDGVTDTVRSLQRDVSPDSGVAPGLEALLESGEKARGMIRDFMAFTGQQTFRPRTVSLNQVVKEAEDTLRGALPQDVGFMVRLCEDTTDVTADPEQMKEILVRLVERAEFSMPDGGYVIVTTEVVTVDEAFAQKHPSAKPGPHVALSITDTGEALDEEARRRIFEPFFSTREQEQENGLGLATVYGMAKQSRGTIEVTSHPGAGTTFRVYLPRVKS